MVRRKSQPPQDGLRRRALRARRALVSVGPGTVVQAGRNGRIWIRLPKTGLLFYDALRAYGAALALEALAIANDRLEVPRIRDVGPEYEVVLEAQALDPGRVASSHRVLSLLASLGCAQPDAEAQALADLLAALLFGAGTRAPAEPWTLWAVVEPAAVKAPRGPSRMALQRRGEMLLQHERPETELPQFAYLAAWGKLTRPQHGERWDGEGIFRVLRGEQISQRLLLLPGPLVDVTHERDAAAVADLRLWAGSARGAACHLLCALALRGVGPGRRVAVDRLRRVQGGQWQPEGWGVVGSAAAGSLQAGPAGLAALEAFRRIYDRAERDAGRQEGPRIWDKPAHAVTDFLTQPSVSSVAALLRALGDALQASQDPGTGHMRLALSEPAIGEVLRVADEPLSVVYQQPSVRSVGRALRQLLRQDEGWQVWEEFVAARAPDDLAQATCDLLRGAATVNRRRREDQGVPSGPVWVPSEDDLHQLLAVAERHGAERVGVAVASLALAIPARDSAAWAMVAEESEEQGADEKA